MSPGETKQSHFDSIYQIIDSGFTHVTTYQLNMCPGSDMFSPEEISLHGLKGRFRILADCIGTYKLFGNEFAMAEIEKICNDTIFNIGKSGQVAADEIIRIINEN